MEKCLGGYMEIIDSGGNYNENKQKFSALVLAATLACTTPVMVYAQDSSSEMVDQAVEILQDNGVDDLLSNPDKGLT